MSFPQKIVPATDSATLDLWRAAEEGELDELVLALPHVPDINARNEHGVTALMRAAQFGHLNIVRVLLKHGADANITRNDKFTALALAAFFGHTEIVRTLMEHGADSKASTRYDTSPHMWATARTYNEVVDELKNTAPPKPVQPAAPVVAEVNVEPVSVAPRLVRTLKDPPEIWDLVHPVAPKEFNAGSAFVSRVKATPFRAAAMGLLIVAVAVGVVMLRRVQVRSEHQAESAPVTLPVDSQTKDSEATVPVSPAPVAEDTAIDETITTSVTARFNRRSNSAHRVKRETSRVADEEDVRPVVAKSEQVNAPERSESAVGNKVSAPLSPQLIAPAKSATPKGKVIQWP